MIIKKTLEIKLDKDVYTFEEKNNAIISIKQADSSIYIDKKNLVDFIDILSTLVKDYSKYKNYNDYANSLFKDVKR